MTLLNKFHLFTGKRRLISTIERTIQLLEKSEDSDWSSLSAKEIIEILKNELAKINKSNEFSKLELAVLYAPTSNIQETAMWNNWHTEYLELAEIIDTYTK